jgi:electron transport complex protein RnfE
MLVLIGSNASVSLIRQWVPKEIRIPVFVMIIATFVTCIQMLMNAYTYGLYESLGIFLPLIVTNCVIIGRAEAYASKNPVKQASFDGFMMGLGFLLVLLVLGAIRELLGQGTLFSGADLLLGEWAKVLTIHVFNFDSHFLLAILPPGAFFAMGFLIATKNVIDKKISEKQPKPSQKTIERVRVSFDAQ